MKSLIMILAAVILTACGGGGDSSPQQSQVAMGAPQYPQAAQATQVMQRSKSAMQAPTNTVAQINGYRANYTIKVEGSQVMVARDGVVQTFTTSHQLQFIDKHVSFDVLGIQGQAYRLYQAAFNRKPDQAGLGFWIYALENGHSMQHVSSQFQSSDEFKTMYGTSVANDKWITLVYNNVLHRDPEPEGFKWWVGMLDGGADRSSALVGFSESDENKKNLAASYSNGIEFIPFRPGKPIVPQSTSYLNTKNIGLSQQTIPHTNIDRTSITRGYAFGDFFRDGTISMVAFSENGNADNVKGNHTIPGFVHFYKKNAEGTWVDETSKLIADRTGCIEPRKVMVSDFNGDGKPDVFAACHGVDDETGVGEQPRILMSQPNGTYSNFGLGFNCYCHGAATIDTDSSGYADIIIVDPNINKQPVYLKNNRNGTFTKDFTRFHDEVKPWGSNFSRPIYTVEVMDVNNDSKPDLVFAGSEKACCVNQPLSGMPTTVYKNDGKNFFKEKLFTIPANDEFPLVLDMVYQNGILYTLRIGYTYQSVAIAGYNVAENKQTMIYSTNSKFENGMHWFDWIVPVNGLIQPLNQTFKVSVK